MKLGTNDIGSVYLGTNAVQKVYLGTNEVWTSFTGLLDDYPNAAAAYSLRLLRSAYTGSAIRVRRASDNTEQDIGFVNNELDTSTLTSFCSGTNGFVKTWYDQSGNGNDATQTTASAQPQIVSSGSLILENGKPTIESVGGSIALILNTTLTLSNGFSILTVLNYTQSNRIFLGDINGTKDFIYNINNSSIYRIRINDNDISFSNYLNLNNQYNSNWFRDSSADVFHSRNGSILGPLASIANRSMTVNSIMRGYNNVNFSFIGNTQEVIIYESDQSSNRTGIETNINNFYSIY